MVPPGDYRERSALLYSRPERDWQRPQAGNRPLGAASGTVRHFGRSRSVRGTTNARAIVTRTQAGALAESAGPRGQLAFAHMRVWLMGPLGGRSLRKLSPGVAHSTIFPARRRVQTGCWRPVACQSQPGTWRRLRHPRAGTGLTRGAHIDAAFRPPRSRGGGGR